MAGTDPTGIDPIDFHLSDDDRRLVAARLGLPAEEAVVLVELLQDECRAHLQRQAVAPEEKEPLLPETAVFAAWTETEREKFACIEALAAALSKALDEVKNGMEEGGYGVNAQFAIDLAAFDVTAVPVAVPDDRWRELWERAPTALAGAMSTIERIGTAANLAMPPRVTAGKKGHWLARLVLKMRDHLDWALPVEARAREVFESAPASGKSPLVQVVGIGLDSMRAAIRANAGDPGIVPDLKDLPAQIGRILANEKSERDRLDAELGQNSG
ncbi:UNVERIFIED_ORG: hypothetical protein M2348_000690 [Sphingomonas sp. R1F5B]